MSYTFGNLKTELRVILFPSGEAPNLVAAHNKYFIDALIDLQTWVACLQADNTNLFPHCATYYRCGMTGFQAPRGRIMEVGVIDKINPDTGEEDATAADDWCSYVKYEQVLPCYLTSYIERSNKANCCLPASTFFAIPASLCAKSCYPTPTDEGLPTGLPLLSLGYHYAQTSTDSSYGRALSGVWGIERGNILIAPWIQSTETVVVKWDGIKRNWNDLDPIDDDPLLKRAVKAWVLREHAKDWDRDYTAAQVHDAEYTAARMEMIHECREETRVRECETSVARSATQTSTVLYYNTVQSATAYCEPVSAGDPVTVTIAAGLVASNISVDDANDKALEQAQAQATAQLDCEDDDTTTYWNVAGEVTVECVGDDDHPTPTGNPVTLSYAAHEYSSTTSQAHANSLARNAALAQAQADLDCTFYNKAVTKSQMCSDGVTLKSVTVAASEHTGDSQDIADAAAEADAQNQLNALLAACPTPDVVYWNTLQTCGVPTRVIYQTGLTCYIGSTSNLKPVTIRYAWYVQANAISSTDSVQAANTAAQNNANGIVLMCIHNKLNQLIATYGGINKQSCTVLGQDVLLTVDITSFAPLAYTCT